MRTFGSIILLLATAALARPALGEQLDQLAREIAELRAEVESLNSELENKKMEMRNNLGSFSMRKADLETSIQRQEVTIEQLRNKITRRNSELEKSHTQQDDLKPMVAEVLKQLEQMLSQSLPFKKKERLQEVQRLQAQFQDGRLAASQALGQIWAFVEDELRLVRDSALGRQIIDLNGNETLADVVRIGMVAMFFRTPDQRFGSVVRFQDQYRFQEVHDEMQKQQISVLFRAFEQGIRVGYFELPNTLTSKRGA